MLIRTKVAAALAAACAATPLVVTASVAHADTVTCRTGTALSSKGAHGWHLQACINTWTAANGVLAQDYWWNAWSTDSNSTDVRVWYTINCPVQGISSTNSKHVYPPNDHWAANGSYPHCYFTVYLTESGQRDIDLGTMQV